jgi:hypothetical protein
MALAKPRASSRRPGEERGQAVGRPTFLFLHPYVLVGQSLGLLQVAPPGPAAVEDEVVVSGYIGDGRRERFARTVEKDDREVEPSKTLAFRVWPQSSHSASPLTGLFDVITTPRRSFLRSPNSFGSCGSPSLRGAIPHQTSFGQFFGPTQRHREHYLSNV